MIINHSGGGVPLNFKVVGGTTQPASPGENMIWVNTSTEISEWAFSNTQPANPVEGMVWLETGLNTQNAFNALKKNAVTVNPNRCHQYVSGAWAGKTAKTYQDGAWRDWGYFLYKNGVGQGITITKNDGQAYVTNNETTITIRSGRTNSSSYFTFQGYNIGGKYKTLQINVTRVEAMDTSTHQDAMLHVFPTTTSTSGIASLDLAAKGLGTHSLDVSSITNGYVGFRLFNSKVTFNLIYLE